MRRSRRFGALVGALAATVLVGAGPVLADPTQASTVDSISAVLGPDGVAVSGHATFVDVPVTIGQDPSGDASPAPIGDDLTSATISRPDAFGDLLTFRLDIANPPPTVDGIPEFLTYAWMFAIRSPGGEPKVFDLQAYRTSQWDAPGGVDPVFVLYRCPKPWTCSKIGTLGGAMAGGVVEWNVPLAAIGALPGSVIGPSIVQANVSVSGLAELVVLDQGPANTKDYTVPAASVRLGIAPAGTAPQDVPLTVHGTPAEDGTFTGEVPAPATPGAYTVVARACYGPASCGLGATSITL